MLQNSKGVAALKAELQPITATGTNPYGFGLIYPETVEYLKLSIDEDTYLGDDQDLGVFAFLALESYIKICSMISRSRPMPRIKLSDHEPEVLDFLDKIGLIRLGGMEDGKQSVIVFRREPSNE